MQKEALEEAGPVPRGPAGPEKIDALSPFGTAGSHWAAPLLRVPSRGVGGAPTCLSYGCITSVKNEGVHRGKD